ncbi:ribulose-phosphate 3-epimerase [Listeria cossartiae subsp. cayugensis]|uniref:Ribulose-phosphate 3-epimerase n=1 Tax=Listeria cossartiae subsp. cayugensis TaxID=2713505 RepID=A0ABU2IRM5_9LIST|nr:ribulose-phosphate 3-epimerase [Listeria cossartiae]MDT0050385.1 ribulose-phosphate 3-epimerase [Listeria cossartiae subsp. cayugensis]MDT0066569.1 ribulose-phosphate 3-epimerase [Listeria cossartiae subsp. cayugensis]MDT0080776.1 ribulose-phosphate 3-epimerase [Listeria cossartiae subsp. cayugensis]MDT0082788.1 ribulose-phosphate 3-epimerase [Listeria cossartiae subsp. cayugensis]MDT0089120.1 ribulose-phosphate 3-epimerase [Listeria cossartiae subsp. cayugensis]
MRKIAASIMCADQLHLGDELRRLESAGVELLHCDVMDGVYVNNLALGPEYLEIVRNNTEIPLDIHLATITPLKYIDMFGPVKPEYISFHVEVAEDVSEVIRKIRSYNVKPSIAINPETPIEAIYPYLDDVEMVLMMTVNPGFAGQKFQTDVLQKLADLKAKLAGKVHAPLIEVDGNINKETVGLMRDCLPDIYVLGTSALFHDRDKTSYAERLVHIWSNVEKHV